MHWATTGQTAAEIIHDRADSKKAYMGLTNWRGTKVRKQDATIAKYYLNQDELAALNKILLGNILYLPKARPCGPFPCTCATGSPSSTAS